MTFCGAISVALLLGFLVVYIVTANDLAWQLQTSLSRMVAQVWPALVLTAFIGLRAPQATVEKPPAPRKAKHKVSQAAKKAT